MLKKELEQELEILGNRCYELEEENRELLKIKKIKKMDLVVSIVIAVFVAANLFIGGRNWQIRKDIRVINELGEKYKALAEEYKEYKAHSWVLSTYDK